MCYNTCHDKARPSAEAYGTNLSYSLFTTDIIDEIVLCSLYRQAILCVLALPSSFLMHYHGRKTWTLNASTGRLLLLGENHGPFTSFNVNIKQRFDLWPDLKLPLTLMTIYSVGLMKFSTIFTNESLLYGWLHSGLQENQFIWCFWWRDGSVLTQGPRDDCANWKAKLAGQSMFNLAENFWRKTSLSGYKDVRIKLFFWLCWWRQTDCSHFSRGWEILYLIGQR